LQSFDLNTVGIPLSAIKKGQSDFSIEVEMTVPYADERVTCQQIRLDTHVTRLGEDLLIQLKLLADCFFNCDRCGENFRRPIQGEITTLFTADKLKLEGTEGGEIRWLDAHATELDLKQEVIDVFFLSIPEKVICREDCRGLCTLCGTNLNLMQCQCEYHGSDPRWDMLKKLKFD
jgi:uncharacterized protein